MPTALWGGLVGSTATYSITWLRERRRTNDAYRAPQREALGGIIAATHELKVATSDLFEVMGLTGSKRSDDAAATSLNTFLRALLGVEKAFAVGKITVVEAACYEQMMTAYNEYSALRRATNVGKLATPAGFTEFITRLKSEVDALDGEVVRLVGIGQDRLSPTQSWLNKIRIKRARVRLWEKYGHTIAAAEGDPEGDEKKVAA